MSLDVTGEWTLEHNGLVVRRGDLVEYQPKGQEHMLAAMIVSVNKVGYSGWGGPPVGTQMLSVRKIKNRRLPKPEDLSDAQIEASQVTRKLERKISEIPLPPPVEKTLFSPFDDENPWKVETFLTPEEWKEVSRWYGYSLRALVFDGTWYEMGRYSMRDGAYSIMKALLNSKDPRHNRVEHHYVIVHCTLQGREGREKAVVGSDSLQMILHERGQRRLKERGR